MPYPILYSYRQCPYAMRARLALAVANIDYELREISLQDKPKSFLQLSPKGTVPVLCCPDGSVIDESLDILHWVFSQHDRERWMPLQVNLRQEMENIIGKVSKEFSPYVYRYRFFEKFPEKSQQDYLSLCTQFLYKLDKRLTHSKFLLLQHPSYVDFAVLPFVYQFKLAANEVLNFSKYPNVARWLEAFESSKLIEHVMIEAPLWSDEQPQNNILMSYHKYIHAA